MITPGTFVVQATDVSGLTPVGKRRKPRGGVSVAQQAKESLEVQAPGKAPKPAAAAEEPEVPSNQADKLAAWLLTRADLDDVRKVVIDGCN
jgi:hypothetical protein